MHSQDQLHEMRSVMEQVFGEGIVVRDPDAADEEEDAPDTCEGDGAEEGPRP